MRNSSTAIILSLLTGVLLIVNWFYISELTKSSAEIDGIKFVNGVKFNGSIVNAPSATTYQKTSNTPFINTPLSSRGFSSTHSGGGYTGSHFTSTKLSPAYHSISTSKSNDIVGTSSSLSGGGAVTATPSFGSSNSIGSQSTNMPSGLASTNSNMYADNNLKGGVEVGQLFGNSSATLNERFTEDNSIDPFGARQKASMQTMSSPLDENLTVLLVLSVFYLFVKKTILSVKKKQLL